MALAIGAVLAVAFTALIVTVSPLQAPTAEIVARTRPNLFDLAVALFAALAGSFAIIRGRGETIVGVAIATAPMPPLAVVGYGIATRNMAVSTRSCSKPAQVRWRHSARSCARPGGGRTPRHSG